MSKVRARYLEQRKRKIERCILWAGVEIAKMTVVFLSTMAMYSMLSIIAYSERGYDAVGGEVIAAALFGAFVFNGIRELGNPFGDPAETKEDTI